MKRLVIIDGKSVFYRGYYAMGALSTSEGLPTGGIYGFAAIAMDIVEQLKPTKVVVAWDSKTSANKRKEIFAGYKAGRKKPEEDFYAQIPYLKELILALGWNFVECENYEADDIIGTLAKQADDSDLSSERSTALKSASAPSQDNGSSLSQLASSEEQLDNFNTLDSKRKPDGSFGAQFAEASKNSSVRFVKDPELHSDRWETFIVSSDLDMLQIVDENTHMYRILKGFSKLEQIDIVDIEAKYGIKKTQFLDLKALKGDASDNIPGVPGVGEKTAVKLLNEYQDLDGVYAHLDQISERTRQKLIAGKDSAYMSYNLAKIQDNAPVKLEEMIDLQINDERIIAALEKLEFRSLVRKFFKQKLDTEGLLDVEKPVEKSIKNSVQNMGVVENSGKSVENLDKIGIQNTSKTAKRSKKSQNSMTEGQQLLEAPQKQEGVLLSWDIKNLMHRDKQIAQDVLQGGEFWDLGQAEFLLNPLKREIVREDEQASYTRQKVELEENPALYRIFTQFDLPLIPILYKIEKRGMLIDRAYFTKMKTEFEKEEHLLAETVWKMAGERFNINSTIQLSHVLFERLALPTKGIRKTSRGYSTGAKELDKLEKLHPIIAAIKDYRETSKLLSTYIVPLPEMADEHNRIHTTFRQNTTATGRLSSINPNLQNIPVRTEVGKKIREGFVAPEGKVLVSADYSQFELRLAAVMANDSELMKDFNAGIDIHTKTAAEAFGVPIKEVTSVQRRAAKVVNFGVLYGMSVHGLTEATGMSFGEAKAFIANYFELRKPIKSYLEQILEQARERGYVETLFGRRRPTPDVLSKNFAVRAGAERAAQNMPIQGTEADLMKRAMIKVDAKLPGGANLVMQVHDSMIVECDKGQEMTVQTILREEMEGVAPELDIKLAVDVKTGKNWGEL